MENIVQQSWQEDAKSPNTPNPNINNNNSDEKANGKRNCGDCLGLVGIMIPRKLEAHQTEEDGIGRATEFDEVVEAQLSDDGKDAEVNDEELCIKPSPPSPSSNRTSVNNSTDNLSYCSDNYFADELFGLQNTVSDDEISINSVDCVYAYRGGGDFDVVPEPRINNEDETDFLEMDFDPDPSSEIDPSIEVQTNEEFRNLLFTDSPEGSRKKYASPIQDDEGAVFKSFPPAHNNSEPNAAHLSGNEDVGIVKDDCDGKTKVTGAKPKKPLNRSSSQSSKQRKQMIPKVRDNDPGSCSFDEKRIHPMIMNFMNFSKDPEETCLDCLEKEFLAKTIGKQIDATICLRCKSKHPSGAYRSSRSCNTSHNDILRVQKSSISFDFNDLMPTSQEDCFQIDATTHKNYQRRSSYEHLNGEQLLARTEREFSKFSTTNIDEKTLVQALDKLDIAYNADVIKAHFNTTERTNFENIGELILYESKKNCDYKQLIKLLNKASMDKLDVHFTIDPAITDMELVRVKSADILQQWEITADLERLKKLNKKFVQLNVLGKVINLIRQSKQRMPKPLSEFILIPQYYPSGYITVMKQ